MTSRSKAVLGLVLAFLVGAVVGLAIGGYGGFRFGTSFILDKALFKDARAVQSHVATLQHLRAGATDQSIELLEAHLDDDLIAFDPAERYPRVTDRTISEINKAIGGVKEYRSANPRKSNRSHVDTAVAHILSRGYK